MQIVFTVNARNAKHWCFVNICVCMCDVCVCEFLARERYECKRIVELCVVTFTAVVALNRPTVEKLDIIIVTVVLSLCVR